MGYELTTQNQVLTLAINGDITLDIFADSVRSFKVLTDGLANEIAPGEKVTWVLETLESGSAVMGVRPIVEHLKTVTLFVAAWMAIGSALQQKTEIPYSEKIRNPAIELAKLMDRGVPSIVFQTNEVDIPVGHIYSLQAGKTIKPKISWGSLKGRIDTLGRRRGVKFTLYDALFDRPIPCYLPEGQEDMVRDYWGRAVIVTGRISRDGETGKPYAIRNIASIELANASEPGSWRKAGGILQLGGNSLEVLRGIGQ